MGACVLGYSLEQPPSRGLQATEGTFLYPIRDRALQSDNKVPKPRLPSYSPSQSGVAAPTPRSRRSVRLQQIPHRRDAAHIGRIFSRRSGIVG
jgi:hypothetical protein